MSAMWIGRLERLLPPLVFRASCSIERMSPRISRRLARSNSPKCSRSRDEKPAAFLRGLPLSGAGGAISCTTGSGARPADPGRDDDDAEPRAADFMVFFVTATALDFSPFFFESLRIAVLVATAAFFAGALFFEAESFVL